MINIEKLNNQFGIERELEFSKLDDDFIFVAISNKYANAEICLHGAHITSFKPHNSMDVLWLSPACQFRKNFPIRGGIPVCFPWFGPHATDTQKPQHGFVRTKTWNVLKTNSLPNGETQIILGIKSSETTKKYWSHEFSVEMIITIGQSLDINFKVNNTSNQTFEYTHALHSYFNISDINNIKIEGLAKTDYYNQLTQEKGQQEKEILQIKDAITRHYVNTDKTCIIDDPAFNRRIQIKKSGSLTTTVWNPGAENCKNFVDLPNDSFHAFVCVESGNSYENIISIAPGESHETITTIKLTK